jgi:HEAT repeat protein
MLTRLFHALTQSKNEAADAVLVEALRLGVEREQEPVLAALLKRGTVRGLSGVIALYPALPAALQLRVLREIKVLHHALRECGRSDDAALRIAAMRLIALGRQGKLAYVLSDNLHERDEALSKAAVEGMVALARWVATETRRLQRGGNEDGGSRIEDGGAAAGPSSILHPPSSSFAPSSSYQQLLEQRPEIEQAVARAMDVHRGRHGQDLLRASMLLCDWPGSKTLGILHTTKHGGQSVMVRRLQQPPASEHVEAFLLGASHGQLRSHFGVAFGHVDEAPVLDALLRKTHWLKDHQLQLCVHQVTRGAWCGGDAELRRDVERRTPGNAALAGEWVAASGLHDVVQDERLDVLRQHAAGDFGARLRLLRVAARRRKGASTVLLQRFLADPDERLVRMAAREIVRRRPADAENILLQLMTTAGDSVRRVISRAIGQAGFEHFWTRYDRLPKATRKQAGRAVLKILPDAQQRLQRRLAAGPVEQRLKAMQMTQELGLAEPMRDTLLALCTDPNPKLRSKAVLLAGALASVPPEALVERLLQDGDARVRANTIEVLEAKRDVQFLPVLAQRARASDAGRERANAIKALNSMKVGVASNQLAQMLRDGRPEHRISALWTLRQIGWWSLLGEVGRLAREDDDLKVRRYALGVLRNVAELARQRQAAAVSGAATAATGATVATGERGAAGAKAVVATTAAAAAQQKRAG